MKEDGSGRDDERQREGGREGTDERAKKKSKDGKRSEESCELGQR